MTNEQKEILLKEISNWSTDDVVALLKKNKLSECCSAIVKRQVDGEELLHLSEGKINLWKSDLARPLRWNLSRFVEDLINNPIQYYPEGIRPISPVLDQSEVPSDSELWDTDFEEDDEPSRLADEDSLHIEDQDESCEMYGNGNMRPPIRPIIPGNRMGREVDDDDYNDNENIYENRFEVSMPVDNVTSNGSSLVGQLKEQLLERELKKKPSLRPKPNVTPKKPIMIENPTILLNSQQSLRRVIDSGEPKLNHESIKRIESAKIAQPKRIPPKPKITPPTRPAPDEPKFKKFGHNLPQPPSSFPRMDNTNFRTDSRSAKADESDEYDYEPINARKNDKQHNISEHLPISSYSIDDNLDVYEMIPESLSSTRIEDDAYEEPSVFNSRTAPHPMLTGSMKKRPPDPRSQTVPITRGQTSRPLPQLPINGSQPDRPVEISDRNFDAPLYTEEPWFHNVGRKEAEALIEGGSSRVSVSPPDGYFLLRPSDTNINQPSTLVLWYKTKVYNIPVRKRPDAQYALGKVKPKELPFPSIVEMVNHYKQNELVLTSGSGDVAVGSTRLTETPPKRND